MDRWWSPAARLRAGLGALAFVYTVVGGWALFVPVAFYADFPAPGMDWVASLPPFNEHLITDVGAGFLAIAAMQWLAAVQLDRWLARAALSATLVQAVPHLGFHLFHAGDLPTVKVVASRIALFIPVVLAAGLLWLTARHPPGSGVGTPRTCDGHPTVRLRK